MWTGLGGVSERRATLGASSMAPSPCFLLRSIKDLEILGNISSSRLVKVGVIFISVGGSLGLAALPAGTEGGTEGVWLAGEGAGGTKEFFSSGVGSDEITLSRIFFKSVEESSSLSSSGS